MLNKANPELLLLEDCVQLDLCRKAFSIKMFLSSFIHIIKVLGVTTGGAVVTLFLATWSNDFILMQCFCHLRRHMFSWELWIVPGCVEYRSWSDCVRDLLRNRLQWVNAAKTAASQDVEYERMSVSVSVYVCV